LSSANKPIAHPSPASAPCCFARDGGSVTGPLVVDRRTIDRLTAMRGPGESYSNVILRLAEGDGGEE